MNKSKRNLKILKIFFLTVTTILLGVFFIGVAYKSWNSFQVSKEEKGLQLAINALEEYQAKYHKYPKYLQELTPEFLFSLPQLPREVEYYGPHDRYYDIKDGYKLIFYDRKYFVFTDFIKVWMVYNSWDKNWHHSNIPD